MATIKSYTDLEQSKVLAEFLPLESADMRYPYYHNPISGASYYEEYPLFHIPINKNKSLPCWSLAALLDVLPEYNLQKTDWGNKTEYKIVVTVNEDNYASKNYNNPLDACYEMILKLHEMNLL